MTRTSLGITSAAVVAWLAAMTGAGHRFQPASRAPAVATFPLSQVRLLDGPFKRSETLNLAYVHALDVDRLLAPFRIEAGLKPKGELYPNWESTGLQGHTAGHYLTALAQAWAATGDAEAKRRLDAMVGELAECQRAHGNGYVGAVPKSRELWAGVAAGTLQVERFGLNGAWVPWYNLHKLFAGLRDAHLIAGSAPGARRAGGARRLVRGARVEAVGRAGAADARRRARRHERSARRRLRAHRRPQVPRRSRSGSRTAPLLDPLTRHEDPLTGLHANTQIPKVIGYGRIAELGGEPAGRDAARVLLGHRRPAPHGRLRRQQRPRALQSPRTTSRRCSNRAKARRPATPTTCCG